ncbi:uncharacterized protein LOC110053938 [Orbicella faveolata]|uniref:uncharacterized protein LOC110053938 n=1 Tax=Orbicella faveolata TaxID=48498 RepID=UPI0009E60AE4|nr:uncharacterized protein LOC110053938 [Orbicella faveolata]
MSRRRRRRHRSFEIEMDYEELTVRTLQFCVMGYDAYSRQKVIGDVLLPLAELANQGIDITRELVMWRDIQTRQPHSSLLRERMAAAGPDLSTIQPSRSQEECQAEPAKDSGQPTETECYAS